VHLPDTGGQGADLLLGRGARLGDGVTLGPQVAGPTFEVSQCAPLGVTGTGDGTGQEGGSHQDQRARQDRRDGPGTRQVHLGKAANQYSSIEAHGQALKCSPIQPSVKLTGFVILRPEADGGDQLP